METDGSCLLGWLMEDDPGKLGSLWRVADQVRKSYVGDAVHLRALLEISNVCSRQCAYCGLRAGNRRLHRYRMNAGEIMACALEADRLGFGTLVLQAGEDPAMTTQFIAQIVRRIRAETGLAITLSLGERQREELAEWRSAGADRYLLRFESSDQELYSSIHPPAEPERPDRITTLCHLRELGYETGSGIMIGLPGQTYESIVNDLLLFRTLDLDMIGVGPFISNPDTPMGSGDWQSVPKDGTQVPNTSVMTCKVLALSRACCPEANIPATTALETVSPGSGYEMGLGRGANVIMPNLTPSQHRINYNIYPGKDSLDESFSTRGIMERIRKCGRCAGSGHGGRVRRPVEFPSC